MTIRIQADHKADGPVSHRWFEDGRFGTIEFGGHGLLNALYFDDPDDIDAVIAELTALRAEMTAARIPAPGWCMAVTSPRAGLTVHCDLRRGHDGAHRSPGWDEGEPDTIWSDEPAASVTS